MYVKVNMPVGTLQFSSSITFPTTYFPIAYVRCAVRREQFFQWKIELPELSVAKVTDRYVDNTASRIEVTTRSSKFAGDSHLVNDNRRFAFCCGETLDSVIAVKMTR